MKQKTKVVKELARVSFRRNNNETYVSATPIADELIKLIRQGDPLQSRVWGVKAFKPSTAWDNLVQKVRTKAKQQYPSIYLCDSVGSNEHLNLGLLRAEKGEIKFSLISFEEAKAQLRDWSKVLSIMADLLFSSFELEIIYKVKI